MLTVPLTRIIKNKKILIFILHTVHALVFFRCHNKQLPREYEVKGIESSQSIFFFFFGGGGGRFTHVVMFLLKTIRQYIPRAPSSARTGFFQLFSKLIMDMERIQSSSATRFTPVSRFPAS